MLCIYKRVGETWCGTKLDRTSQAFDTLLNVIEEREPKQPVCVACVAAIRLGLDKAVTRSRS